MCICYKLISMLSGQRCLKANRHGLKATKLSYGFCEVFENYFKWCPFPIKDQLRRVIKSMSYAGFTEG